jgi:hypothetical protein
LLDVLAIAVTTDALVTLAEALDWNARHARSLVEALVVFVACAAPALAALVLWGARARVRRIYEAPRPRPARFQRGQRVDIENARLKTRPFAGGNFAATIVRREPAT